MAVQRMRSADLHRESQQLLRHAGATRATRAARDADAARHAGHRGRAAEEGLAGRRVEGEHAVTAVASVLEPPLRQPAARKVQTAAPLQRSRRLGRRGVGGAGFGEESDGTFEANGSAVGLALCKEGLTLLVQRIGARHLLGCCPEATGCMLGSVVHKLACRGGQYVRLCSVDFGDLHPGYPCRV